MTEIKLDHPKIHSFLQSYMRFLAMHAAFTTTPEVQASLLRMILRYNEGEDCYTNFRSVVLGLSSKFLNGGDIDRTLHKAKTIIGHEVGHKRLTNKRDWDQTCHRYKRTYKLLGDYAVGILNILEDRRMERIMGMVSEFLQRNFFLLGFEELQFMEQEVNAEISRSLPNTEQKLMIIRNALLYASYTRMLPNIKHVEIKHYLSQCYGFILYARESKTTKGAVLATDKILEILKPLIEEYEKIYTDKIAATSKIGDMGTSSPMEGDEIEGISDKKEAVAYPDEVEDMLRKLFESAKAVIEEEDGPEADAYDPIEGGDALDGDSDVDSSDPPKKGEPIAGESLKDGTAAHAESDLFREAEDIAKKLEEYDASKTIEGAASEFRERDNKSMDAQSLNDFLNSDGPAPYNEKFKDAKEDLRINQLDPVIRSDMHNGCRPVFKKRDKMGRFTRHEYESLLKPLQGLIRKVVAQIREITQLSVEDTMRFQRTGRLDRKSMLNYLAFTDSKIFKTKDIEKKQLTMEIMLLVDISGSNSTSILNNKNNVNLPRYKMNQTVALMLHEIMKTLRFKHTVWTFYEHTLQEQRFSSLVDNGNCFDKDAGLFLKEIGAKSGNRDGYAIRYAGEYLNRYGDSDNRLLIVLSDGQPAAQNYGGENAMNDVKGAVEEVQKGGSKVIGIFTGSPQENRHFEKMYPNHIFVNNENIYELPKIMKKLLIGEFQEYINKII